MAGKGIDKLFSDILSDLTQTAAHFAPDLKATEVGRIVAVSPGIARVSGLQNLGSDELVEFDNGGLGVAFNLDEDEVGVVLFCEHMDLQAGDEVRRLGRVMDVLVGNELLGRVIDPLGRPLDGGKNLSGPKRLPVERPAAAIMDRLPVTEPLQTGIVAIDAMVPIGRGQRELIIGDRKTGKTAIAIDTIISQRSQNVVCVYCAIGQRASAVAKVIDKLQQNDAMAYTVVVVAEGSEPAGISYLAPYAAASIAEAFMEQGQDVLVVYDDLTQHARSYRELSLLLRRPPGREAFPGDIFYIHSRLLERSTHLKPELGGGSLTALPIVETEAQNIAAYIPTNLISITDGQVYLSPTLFELGVLPAVDIGKSVSRVGGKAQRAVYRSLISDLKLAFAQYEELESFIRYGARLDESSRQMINYGRQIQACLKQAEQDPFTFEEQILVLVALTSRQLDAVPIARIPAAKSALQQAARRLDPALAARLATDEKLSDADHQTLVAMARQSLDSFVGQGDQGGENQ